MSFPLSGSKNRERPCRDIPKDRKEHDNHADSDCAPARDRFRDPHHSFPEEQRRQTYKVIPGQNDHDKREEKIIIESPENMTMRKRMQCPCIAAARAIESRICISKARYCRRLRFCRINKKTDSQAKKYYGHHAEHEWPSHIVSKYERFFLLFLRQSVSELLYPVICAVIVIAGNADGRIISENIRLMSR